FQLWRYLSRLGLVCHDVNALLGNSVVASWGLGAVSSRRNWDSWLGIFHRAARRCGAEFHLFSFAGDGVVGGGRSYRWFGNVAGVVTKMTAQKALKQLLSAGQIERTGPGCIENPFRYFVLNNESRVVLAHRHRLAACQFYGERKRRLRVKTK